MNRNSIIKKLTKLGQDWVKNTEQRENLRWSIGEAAFNLRSTFQAGQEKAALASAATAVGLTEGDVGNLIRAYEARQDLTQAQRDKTASWTTDAVLTLRGKEMTPAKRTQLIDKAAKKNTQNVKTLREIKKSVVTPASRQRKNATDAKIALAKKLAKDLDRLFKNGHDPVSLAAGAQLAQGNPGADVAAAITFHAAQVKKTAVVAS